MPTGHELFSLHFTELRHHLHRVDTNDESLRKILDREYDSEKEFLDAFESWRIVENARHEFRERETN